MRRRTRTSSGGRDAVVLLRLVLEERLHVDRLAGAQRDVPPVRQELRDRADLPRPLARAEERVDGVVLLLVGAARPHEDLRHEQDRRAPRALRLEDARGGTRRPRSCRAWAGRARRRLARRARRRADRAASAGASRRAPPSAPPSIAWRKSTDVVVLARADGAPRASRAPCGSSIQSPRSFAKRTCGSRGSSSGSRARGSRRTRGCEGRRRPCRAPRPRGPRPAHASSTSMCSKKRW